MEQPRYPSIWATLGMVLALYGLGYAYAAWRLERAAPFIAIGLLGKVLGPIGWLGAVAGGELATRTLPLIVFDDLVWWIPFALFLLDGTRLATRVRAAAPAVAAIVNLMAALALVAVLRQGTDLGGNLDARTAYVTTHVGLWRAGWGLWIGAALTLVAFYAWWWARLGSTWTTLLPLGVATAGLAVDLLAESLLIGWAPERYADVADRAFFLTGFGANGLYTIAGALLTLRTPAIRGGLAALAWSLWTSGGLLSAAILAGAAWLAAIATGALFTLLPLFCFVLRRNLR